VDDRVATALCVLGPLGVVRDGERARLGSGQQRRLLAALLVHANQVVSSDRLVEVLWGERPPPSAPHVIQGLVSRLRATLGDDRLVTSPPGYRLQVESGEVDALRFEELVRVGLAALEQPEVAVSVFDESLGLWRGSPYVEFADEEFATAEVARLFEVRARAIEERSAALLELGRPEEVIGELEVEITVEPFRERLRALLMLALARSGRPVDALRVYDAFRRFLADEVGVVPSPGLQELNDDIVRQHPDVSWSGSPTNASGTASLPSGTVTFLFTDVEGATSLWEEHPDLMRHAVVRHNEIVRDVVRSNGGFIVKTMGDGFHAVFADAHHAVMAAVAAQTALLADDRNVAEPLRVRMGIHTGQAEVRDGDYSGSAVNRGARLMSAAHGGQIVVSAATEELLHDALPEKYGFIDLGEHRLRDLGRPEHLFQVVHPDLGREFEPLRTLDALPGSNLPAPVDSFIGRRAELADVLDALGDGRLVTLTGPGGSGKTRLALEAAATALSSFRDGVWFVSLAVADGERVVPLVAAALGVSETTNRPLADKLEDWLRDRQLLLVLDNCEPVVEAVASFAARYLARCAGVRILATSREVLGVRGERALATPPLTVADDPADAGGSDAVELFMVRASAAAPGFDVASADVGVVAEICRRLDGLPLAIELAAARLRVLSLEQIATRLGDRFRLLRGRERTLEAAVSWSYELLSDAEREVFVRLAVFPADFSLDAAEMVVSDAAIGVRDVLDVLTRLVEKSLVTTVISGDTYRYLFLETLREYALARLDERGEVDRWNDRLLEWAMTRVEYVEESMRRPAQDAALQSVSADAATLRAAMTWADTRGDQLAALRIASAVPIGLIGERRQIVASLLERLGSGVEPWFAGHAYSALANFAAEQGDWTASSEYHATAAEHFVLAGSARNAAWATYFGVTPAWGAGDLAKADALIRQAIDGFRSDGDEMGLGNAMSFAALLTTDLDEAQRLAAEADELLRVIGSPTSVAHTVEIRGIIAYDRDELADAAAFVAEALAIFSSYDNLGCSAHALECAAVIVDQAGQPETATELLGAAEELRHRSGQGHKLWEIRARHNDIDDRIAPLPPAVREAALTAGRQYTLESAARVALDALSTAARDRA
jgi:predicted ATPase/class 3 adenylate cyclase